MSIENESNNVNKEDSKNVKSDNDKILEKFYENLDPESKEVAEAWDRKHKKYESSYVIGKGDLSEGQDIIDFLLSYANIVNKKLHLTRQNILDNKLNFSAFSWPFELVMQNDELIISNTNEPNNNVTNQLLQELVDAAKNNSDFNGDIDLSTRREQILKKQN